MIASVFRKAAFVLAATGLLWISKSVATEPKLAPKSEKRIVISAQEADAFLKAMFDTVAVVNNKPASWNKDNGEVSDGFIESAKGIMRVFKDQGRVPAGKYYSTANGDKLETPNSAGYAFDITTPADAATLIVAGTQIRKTAPDIYHALRFLTASPVGYSVGEISADEAFVATTRSGGTVADATNSAVDAAVSGWKAYTKENPIRSNPTVTVPKKKPTPVPK